MKHNLERAIKALEEASAMISQGTGFPEGSYNRTLLKSRIDWAIGYLEGIEGNINLTTNAPDLSQEEG